MQRSSFIPITSEKSSTSHGMSTSSTSSQPRNHESFSITSNRSVIPTPVLAKLAFFMVALLVAPLGSYFIALWYWFPENAMYSGILAVVVANLIVVAYCVVAAFEEDPKKQSTLATSINDSKKEK
ncbi:hypothetical protein HMI55_002180 [Coelomomyces lativittatus]|nr:hypothetical protein HMI55_002180 [Coelomomyces lativittatus]KAJ1510684.1 hypothetical protein HMI56_006221 [Coelomomyces lativittatus]